MLSQPKCIAIKLLACLALLGNGVLAYAGEIAGTITHLSGPLIAKKMDGTVKVLALQSTVEQGDTLVTEKRAYARIKFVDNSEMTIRPDSQVKIDSFTFEAEQPKNDSAVFNLIKGGLRAVTGVLGKRNRERFGLTTPIGTIGIRGTIFIVEYVVPEVQPAALYGRASVAAANTAVWPAQWQMANAVRSDAPLELMGGSAIAPLQLAQNISDLMPASGANNRAPGLYVQVLDGMIHLSNQGGAQNFAAGQFGYTPNVMQPPIILPANPGMQFTPPPAFTSSVSAPGEGGAAKPANNVNCEVR